MSVGSWIREGAATYLSNATATRDFRVQLRGSRSVLLFGIYLALLIVVGMFIYSQTAGDQEMSVVEAQRQLNTFYQVVMVLLATVVSFVAPALTATTVVAEKQRRSLDLVFSAPVAPKYFLVGKMIASYRYTWMLLVLSLPVTAACVVLGGASWQDVIVAYVLLSLHALMFTSFGLLMSTVAQKPVAAIVWSYAGTFAYLFVTTGAGLGSALMPGATREQNFFVAMSPFSVVQAADTYSLINLAQVPNWILAGLVCFLISKICVLTAGAILAPFVTGEIRSLRIHGLVYLGLIAWYGAYLISPSVKSYSATTMAGTGYTPPDPSVVMGVYSFWLLCPLFILLPLFACYGNDAERRYMPNGLFKFREAFNGTPAGALPYLLLLVGASAGSLLLGAYMGAAILPGIQFWCYLAFTVGFWTFFWSVARYTSSMMQGLRSARALQFAAFVLLVVLPVPFLSAISVGRGSYDTSSSAVWEVYVLRPLFTSEPDRYIQALIYGVIMLLLAWVVARISEKKLASKLSTVRSSNESAFSPT